MGFFRTLDRPGQTLLTCRTLSADGEGAECGVILALGIFWWWCGGGGKK